MPATISQSVRYYSEFYKQYALDTWRAMTPMEYGCLLIGIGVFGWLLMKSGAR